MDWLKIITIIIEVITLLAFLYQICVFIKTKDIYEGVWAILFWVALMTIA